jgi:hypothetical protein
MRAQLAAAAGIGFALASACGGSRSPLNRSTSGSGGTTNGAGSTTGGTTGSTTSGGTTGGEGLAPGDACTANAQCLSLVCGVNGSGHCCTAACATGDAACGALACDNLGTCTYPSGGFCGTDVCSAGELTQGACNGSGNCTPGTPTPCPNHLVCKDATSCAARCGVSTDCVAGFYCETASGQCIAQQQVGPCVSNATCTSGFCGIDGGGNCCTAQCAPATDPACHPTSCDASSGACVYPAGIACGTITCVGDTLTTGACDATGSCKLTSASCARDLVCNDGGTTCLTTCAVKHDCVTGFYCNGGICAAQQATGPCNTNDACTSAICGVSGTGHCCTAACSTSDPTCGASDCNFRGGCAYTNDFVACGAPPSCTGTIQTNRTNCDGLGKCLPATTVDCTPFLCGATTCLTSCTDATSCVSGAFCDISESACCGLSSGGAIGVDGIKGNDATGCCGVGASGPCQTISRAMALIDTGQARNVTIHAKVNGGGGDWAAPEPAYPILLGWGVELSAPGVFFLDPNTSPNGPPNTAILEIKAYPQDALGYASVVGTAANPVGVGMNAANTQQTDDRAAIAIDTGSTLYLANATINSSVGNVDSAESIRVKGGAGLVFGQDQSATVTGTVTIGNALGQFATNGWQGIICLADEVNHLGCTIKDATLTGQSSVVIQGQEGLDIDAEDFANISLTSNPVIGVKPSAAGFGTCPWKPDAKATNTSVLLNGLVSLTFNNGTVQCITGRAFQLHASPSGTPAVSIGNTVIRNTDLGIYASAGIASVTGSTISYNFIGVQQDTDAANNNGTIDLSDGGNTVICSNKSEYSQGATTHPGIDVLNSSVVNLNASYVAWDTAGPDYFQCDSAFASCTCNDTSCTTDAGSDDMDAVEVGDAGITTTGNTQSPLAVDAGCG